MIKHKIGEMVCFCNEDKIIGYIDSYDGMFYKVSWSGNIFPSSNDINWKKEVSFHTEESITVMKEVLKELYNEG